MKISTLFCRATLLMVLTVALVFNNANGQVPNDSIVADFNDFERILEETHPDPYTNYGGRPFFRKAAMETRFGLIQDKVTDVREFAWRINEFLAPLKDGHTMAMPDGPFVPGHFPINYTAPSTQILLETINDGIIVKALPDEYKNLVGSRLIAIENVPIKELADKMSKYFIAENETGRMMNLAHYAMQPIALRKAVAGIGETSITYQLKTAKGKKAELTLPIVPYNQVLNWQQKTQSPSVFPGKQLDYDFMGMLQYGHLDEGKNTMYFHVAHMVARDILDRYRENGYDCSELLGAIYGMVGMPVPGNQDMAIAMIPSLSEEFEKMLQLMKQNGSKNLIVDLRGNGGGYTQICYPLVYQLYGDEYLKVKDNLDDGEGGFLITPQLVSNNRLEQWNTERDCNYQYGDYIQYSPKEPHSIVSETMRNAFINGSTCSIKDKLKGQQGQPVYLPEHVYVLTDPTTFSAAFHFAYYLWKMGATIVGVPSSQAPNTYMGQLPFTLKRTGLEGEIDMTIQKFFPDNDPRAKEFTPDMMPTYEDYKRYNFDDNTIPLYLMDIINKKQ